MLLYNVPNNTLVRLPNLGCEDDEFLFHHIDGTYSYCTDSRGNIVHLRAWEEVEVVNKEINGT